MKTISRSLFLGMLVMVGIHTFVSTALSQTFLTNGLVAYFPFTGNANDASGNGNNAINNGATLTTDRFGLATSAYDFDGTSSYMSVPQNAVLNAMTNLTLSAWIFSRVVNDTSTFISKQSAGISDGWLFDTGTGCIIGQPIHRVLRLQGSVPTGCDGAMGVTEYSLLEWHHIVAVISGTTASLYLDGKLDGSGNAGNIPLNTLDLWVGSQHPSPRDPIQHNYFNGFMDDIRIYSRALSASEVQQLYAIESGPRVDLIKAVKPSFFNLTLTTNYQMQISGDLNAWTNHGSAFTATNNSMVWPEYFDVDNWGSLFFRLRTAP